MIEFTPEWIAKIRLSSHLIEPPAAEVIGELLDEIQRLQSCIAELEAEQRWMPVSESNPTETGNYFVICKKEYVGTVRPVIDHFNEEIGKWINTEKYITHWQERPKPPKMEDNKES